MAAELDKQATKGGGQAGRRVGASRKLRRTGGDGRRQGGWTGTSERRPGNIAVDVPLP